MITHLIKKNYKKIASSSPTPAIHIHSRLWRTFIHDFGSFSLQTLAISHSRLWQLFNQGFGDFSTKGL